MSLKEPQIIARQVLGIFSALICLLLFGFFCSFIPAILEKNSLSFSFAWIETLQIPLSFHLDSLSLLFALLITGIGSFIMWYSSDYFKFDNHSIRIQGILMLFMTSMLGLVLADHVIELFVFWELTTITSFLLIGTKHEEGKAREMAMQALLVTGGGGLLFLIGLITLGLSQNTWQISTLANSSLINDACYPLVFLLLIIGCFTKSAQFPFHFWLPNAMKAPTPISAYLHSATMVKAGIYFMARFYPMLSGTPLWHWTLALAGGITMIWSSMLAYKQTDLKLMLAYTTLMALGLITMLLAMGSALTVTLALIFLVVHALYKASLFLLVGNLEKATSSRSWKVIHSVGHLSPASAMAALLAAFSMASIPPSLGFLVKESLYADMLTGDMASIVTIFTLWIAGTLMAGIAFFFMYSPFWSKKHQAINIKKISINLVMPPFILSVLAILSGLWSSQFEEYFQIVSHALKPVDTFDFHWWHGFNLPLMMSISSIIIGILIARRMDLIHQKIIKLSTTTSVEKLFSQVLHTTLRLFRHITLFFQNGNQRFYLIITFTTLGAVLLSTSIHFRIFEYISLKGIREELFEATFYQAGLVAIMAFSVLTTVLAHSRLFAICSLGVMGTAQALIFTLYSAPDVAMTQFMVEILVVILVSIIIKKLPTFSGLSHGSTKEKVRDGLLASSVGLLFCIILLSITQSPLDQTLNLFFEENSLSKAHGKNIVNVILVDFRALDTLGEIIVVGLAGLGCWSLVKVRGGQET